MSYRKIIDSFKARRLTEQEIGQRLSDLMLLFDFSSSLNQTTGYLEVVNLLLLTLMGCTASRRAVFFNITQDGLEPIQVKGYRSSLKQTFRSCTALAQHYLHEPETKGEWADLCETLGLRLLVPLQTENRLIAIIGLGGKTGSRGYSFEEIEMVMSVVQLCAASLENAQSQHILQDLNRQLRLKIYQLNTLFELSKDFNSVWDSETIFGILGNTLIGQLLVSRCAVLTLRNRELEPRFVRGIKLTPGDLEWLAKLKLSDLFCAGTDPILCANLPDESVRQFCLEHKIPLAVPMVFNEEIRGVLFLGEKKNRQVFRQEDYDFIITLGNLALLADENAQMQQQMIEKHRMEKELAIARETQIGLLPHTTPKIAGYEICSVFRPCYTVGGDYFDFLPLSENELAVAIADVSGKSTPAALLMASIQASLRTLTSLKIVDPRTALEKINVLLCENQTRSNKYVTFFFGILHKETHQLIYVNAGHCYPLVIKRNGSVDRLETGGMVLGFFPDATYRVGQYNIEPGDSLILYTDGVTELINDAEEEFGADRIAAVLKEHQDSPAEGATQALLKALEEHRQDQQQADDLTFILMKRK